MPLAADVLAGVFRGELGLDDEVRGQLGLAPGEGLRVLQAGGRTVVLERTGGSSSMALPWDRDLVLSADVRAFPLADVLHLVHGSGKSGFLLFECGEHEKAVYLHRGEVVFAASNQAVDRLGECLLRAEIISLEQLRDTEQAFTHTDRFGKILVERGYLAPRELWNGVKLQVEEIVRSLFAYTAGAVHFWEGEVQPDNVVRLSLPTRRLISEGLRRRDELYKFLANLEDPRVRLFAQGSPRDLSGNERAVWEALDAEDRFAGLCRQAGLDPLSTARTLGLLQLSGMVRVDRSETQAQETGAAGRDEDTVRECVLDHVKLLAELVAPIVAVDGPEPVTERVDAVVAEAAARWPELLAELRVGIGGVFDPDELTQRALRLTGDRERGVRAALGELVAYFEFELKNHPRIPEPDHFLDAVEGLRAKIEL